jgi:hypothetical protein
MPTTITTASGRTRELPPHLEEWLADGKLLGLDQDGRFVVDQFNAREEAYVPFGPDDLKKYVSHPFLFGLTLCCDAWDKGTEDGVVCRSCYGAKGDDPGNYIFKEADGSFPGLDPIAEEA